MKRFKDYDAWKTHIRKATGLGMCFEYDNKSPTILWLKTLQGENQLTPMDSFEMFFYLRHLSLCDKEEDQRCIDALNNHENGYDVFRNSIIRRFGDYAYEWENTKVYHIFSRLLTTYRFKLMEISRSCVGKDTYYENHDLEEIIKKSMKPLDEANAKIPEYYQGISKDIILFFLELNRQRFQETYNTEEPGDDTSDE